MNRIVIKCKKCKRLLLANPSHETRRCHACNHRNAIKDTTVHEAASVADANQYINEHARQPGFSVEKVRTIKTRRARK